MRFVNRAALMLLLVVGACLSIGCSEETTGPNKNPPPPAGSCLWSERFGDGDGQLACAVAVDGSGNVIVTGDFSGTVDFGGGALTSAGGYDIFVVKFGPKGAPLWSKCFGDANHQGANAVAVDGSGNVIVTGNFEGTVGFGGGYELTSAGGYDIFVVKFGPTGAPLWSKCFGDGEYQSASSVAVDESGNVIVTGAFYGAVDFGGGALTSVSYFDLFVVKLGPDGTHLWSTCFGGDNDNQCAKAVAVDESGNIIVAGEFEVTVDFGGGALMSLGSYDIFVVKFGPADGGHLWSERFGDANHQGANAVAVDGSGNVIVTGDFSGTVYFGSSALTSAGSSDIYVVKFGPTGAPLWSKRFGDGEYQSASSVAVDESGNVIVTGAFYGAVDFGGGALTSAGDADIYVVEFGPDGAHLWSKRFGDVDHQGANAVAVDGSGNVIVTGDFNGTVDFGGGALTSAGDSDIFIAKFGR